MKKWIINRIWQPKDQRGPNGETWCVFFELVGDFINSGWRWYESEYAARKYAPNVLAELNGELPETK